jgi:transcriptional regulator with XRE-family HTH domain
VAVTARLIDADSLLRGIGRRVRIARLTREMTQDELADATGISRSFVSSIERGSHGVDVVRLYRLAAALDVPLPELLVPLDA